MHVNIHTKRMISSGKTYTFLLGSKALSNIYNTQYYINNIQLWPQTHSYGYNIRAHLLQYTECTVIEHITDHCTLLNKMIQVPVSFLSPYQSRQGQFQSLHGTN